MELVSTFPAGAVLSQTQIPGQQVTSGHSPPSAEAKLKGKKDKKFSHLHKGNKHISYY
jgi:hypothetical protein